MKNKTSLTKQLALAAAAIVALPLAGNSAVIQSLEYSSAPNYTVASTNNMLAGITPVATDSSKFQSQEGTSTNLSLFTNLAAPNFIASAYVAVANNGQLTFTLGPGGANLSSFVIYTAWGNAGRDDQNYTISYSTLSNPTTFNLLLSTKVLADQNSPWTPSNTDGNINPFPPSPNSQTGMRVTFSDSEAAYLATNVAAIQVNFGNQENGYVGYGEIAAYGVAAVPEPATLGLALAGLSVVAIRRRRA